MEMKLKKIPDGLFKGLFYRDSGDGFPVMLVHGFPFDGTLWDYQGQSLQKSFRLLIPDLPGSGQSPVLPSISMEGMADALNAILVRERIDRFILIGHSMGGYTTLAFAEKYAEKLKGFGLYHATAFEDSEEKKQGRKRSVSMMQQYGGGPFLHQILPAFFGDKYRRNNKEALQALIKSKENAAAEALVAYYEAMMQRPDRTHVLIQSKVPVLFVLGKEDTAAPPADVLQQVSLPVVSEVHLLADVAHMSMLEMPDASSKILEQFIRFCIDFPFA